MGYGKKEVKTLTEDGQVSAAGTAARLLWAYFVGQTAGDQLSLRDGNGGTVLITLKSGAYIGGQIGPFTRENAPVFSADIYADFTLTTSGVLGIVWENLE